MKRRWGRGTHAWKEGQEGTNSWRARRVCGVCGAQQEKLPLGRECRCRTGQTSWRDTGFRWAKAIQIGPQRPAKWAACLWGTIG